MPLLARYLLPTRIVTLRSRTREGAIRELAAVLASGDTGLDPEVVIDAVRNREKIVSSWIAPGIAIPHARLPVLEGIEVAVGRSRAGVAWDSGDGDPVHLLFLIVSGDTDPDQHVLLLAEIARTLRDRALMQLVLTARSPAEAWRLLVTRGYGEQGSMPAASAKVRLSRLLFAHALSVAEEVKAKAVMLHGDAVGSLLFLQDIPSPAELILVTSSKADDAVENERITHVLQVPFPTLDRFDQVELALLFAVSQGLLSRGDTVVSLSGVPSSGFLDTLLVIDVGREFPTVFAKSAETPLGDVQPQVLEKVLQLATDIAREGREGKPVGTTFVLGDYERVVRYCRQMVINPFRGYSEEEKSILDPSLEETVKEFSTIDGAFIIRGDGVIMSAGTFLRPEKDAPNLPSGLGARHAAAAALSETTASLAVVVSQSTGSVSLFKGGGLVMSLEKSGSAGAMP
ncbi:MAG: diadenylate cyclase [Spirochaetia bacterium]|jgi:DNA integrity scanning protein DisA with diadenylate cyclase activity/mannitol/fructose-specific phosphotransferase system IIA component (Ntr-type)